MFFRLFWDQKKAQLSALYGGDGGFEPASFDSLLTTSTCVFNFDFNLQLEN